MREPNYILPFIRYVIPRFSGCPYTKEIKWSHKIKKNLMVVFENFLDFSDSTFPGKDINNLTAYRPNKICFLN